MTDWKKKIRYRYSFNICNDFGLLTGHFPPLEYQKISAKDKDGQIRLNLTIIMKVDKKTLSCWDCVLTACMCCPRRVATVADRFFTTNISVQLLQASWYPTEMCHTPYLCVLSSDNTLRMYNINGDVQTAVQTHRLRPSNDMQNMSIGGSHLSLLSMYVLVTSRQRGVLLLLF